MKAAGALTGYFYSGGDIPNKGCFTKGDSMFFGTGGTDAEMNESDLGGEMKTRVWCDAATIAFTVFDESPSSEETRDASSSTGEMQDNGGSCLTEDQCEEKFTLMKNANVIDGDFYTGTEYPTKGCFVKGSNVFFGIGGTDSEMTSSVPKEQARLLCDGTPDKPKSTAETKRSIYIISGAVVGSIVLLSAGIIGLKRYKRKA
jgi:hypothetical protein